MKLTVDKDVILHGPGGSGKTFISQRLKKVLGLERIIEVDSASDLKTYYGQKTLFITNEVPRFPFWSRRKYKTMDIWEAKELLRKLPKELYGN